MPNLTTCAPNLTTCAKPDHMRAKPDHTRLCHVVRCPKSWPITSTTLPTLIHVATCSATPYHAERNTATHPPRALFLDLMTTATRSAARGTTCRAVCTPIAWSAAGTRSLATYATAPTRATPPLPPHLPKRLLTNSRLRRFSNLFQFYQCQKRYVLYDTVRTGDRGTIDFLNASGNAYDAFDIDLERGALNNKTGICVDLDSSMNEGCGNSAIASAKDGIVGCMDSFVGKFLCGLAVEVNCFLIP